MPDKALAQLLFPHIEHTPEDYESVYPPRLLPEGAKVTRIGPSPTGFIHLGNLYNALIGERLAHQSQGLFYLRVEDTDKKREVPGAVESLLSAMDFFGMRFDEGALPEGAERGAYGPYRQSERKSVYQAVAKRLVELGQAYPCFCSESELAALRARQTADKLNFGYWGEFARCRRLELEDIQQRLEQGRPWVLRFRSRGSAEQRVRVYDAIRGELSLQENDQDFVLLKGDGLPTYHFAHVVDDHYMRTTHVVRGEEWLATLPLHVQVFDTLGWPRPIYCHTAQLMKLEGEVRRKLSKRNDPELALDYYRAEGYLPAAIREYLLTVLNSNFEEWRLAHPALPAEDFPFSTDKMSNSGALFDLDKLNDISKDMLCALPAREVYVALLNWCKDYAPDFAALLRRDTGYAQRILMIGKGGERPRKDLVNWRQAVRFLAFYFDETFRLEDDFPANVDAAARREILALYLDTLDFSDDNSAWFAKIRDICVELNYAPQPKKYQRNPELYRGSIVDVSNTVRVAITGRLNSPDLWEISQALGEERCRKRIMAVL